MNHVPKAVKIDKTENIIIKQQVNYILSIKKNLIYNTKIEWKND